MKKSAFTLIETLVSLLIISAIGIVSMKFVSSYMKNTYDRDVQTAAAISNLSIAEELKAEVKTLPQLYSFIQGKDIKVTAVGLGEISLNPDGTYTVINSEAFEFSSKVKSATPRLFKIEIGSELPNTKITAVIIL